MSKCKKCDEASSDSSCGCFGDKIVIPKGPKGDIGLNAYQVWLSLGNTGTEQEFINSLTGPQGQQGIQGMQGISIQTAQISDGTTPIGGTVYTINNVIFGLSDNTYINAGALAFPAIWTPLTLINGWVPGNLSGSNTPEYFIDAFNFIHFRGTLDGSGASVGADFANLVIPTNTRYHYASVGSNALDADNSFETAFITWNGATGVMDATFVDNTLGVLLLEDLGPLYVG